MNANVAGEKGLFAQGMFVEQKQGVAAERAEVWEPLMKGVEEPRMIVVVAAAEEERKVFEKLKAEGEVSMIPAKAEELLEALRLHLSWASEAVSEEVFGDSQQVDSRAEGEMTL